MRKYQITIKLSFFDGLRKPTEARELNVYADGNDLWGTICGGFHQLVHALVHTGNLPNEPYVVKQHEWR